MWFRGGRKLEIGEGLEEVTFAVRLFKPGDRVFIWYKGKELEGIVKSRVIPTEEESRFDVEKPEPLVEVETKTGLLYGLASEGYIRFQNEPPCGSFVFKKHYRLIGDEDFEDFEDTPF